MLDRGEELLFSTVCDNSRMKPQQLFPEQCSVIKPVAFIQHLEVDKAVTRHSTLGEQVSAAPVYDTACAYMFASDNGT